MANVGASLDANTLTAAPARTLSADLDDFALPFRVE
jgi:hypothetical protein